MPFWAKKCNTAVAIMAGHVWISCAVLRCHTSTPADIAITLCTDTIAHITYTVMCAMVSVHRVMAISAGYRWVVPRSTFRSDIALQNALGNAADAVVDVDDAGQHA